MSFYSDPWGMQGGSLLAGPTTYNLMGEMPATVAPAAPAASTPGSFGMTAAIAGGVMSAVGAFYSAQSAKSNLRFQADMADLNARMMEKSAQSVLSAGQAQVGQMTMRAGRVRSSQKAAMAANGIVVGEGSSAEVLATTDLIKEIDKATIEANAIRSAFGYRTQAVNASNQALIGRANAEGISPAMSAGTSLISSASNVAQSWYTMNKTGMI